MKKKAAKTSKKTAAATPSTPARAPAAPDRIDHRIRELNDWRGETLSRVRALIQKALPQVVEEWKWDVPVWSHPETGIICTGETYKKAVKLTFARGASVPDPSSLFNSSLDGNTRRAIDLHQGGTLDEKAFMALIRAAAQLPSGGGRATRR